jgi:acyl carrier protein
MTNDAVARITAIVAEYAGGAVIDPDTPFLLDGLVDSFAVIQIVGRLEDAFGIAIEPEDLTQDNFATVARIAALVERVGA